MSVRALAVSPRSTSRRVSKTVIDPYAGNLLSLFESYERSMRAENKSDSTIRNYGTAVRQLDAFLTFQRLPRHVRAITREHVNAFVAYLLATQSDVTASQRRLALVSFFKWCVQDGVLEESPMDGTKHIKPKKKPKEPIPEDDVKKLLHASKGKDFESIRDNAIAWFFVNCGSRIGGVHNLLAEDVDLRNNIATLRLKGGDKVVIHFQKKTTLALDRYSRARADHPLSEDRNFFIGRHGGLSTRGLYFVVERLCKRAGVKRYNPHRFRNTSAVMALLAGIPESAVTYGATPLAIGTSSNVETWTWWNSFNNPLQVGYTSWAPGPSDWWVGVSYPYAGLGPADSIQFTYTLVPYPRPRRRPWSAHPRISPPRRPRRAAISRVSAIPSQRSTRSSIRRSASFNIPTLRSRL